MDNVKLLSMVSLIAFMTVGCATPQAKVGFDKNSKINISHYKTFVWLNDAKILAPVIDINPVMKVRVDNAIENAFIQKGYLLIDDPTKADFAISYRVGNRDKVHSYPVTYNNSFKLGGDYHRGRYNDVLITHGTTARSL